MSSGSGTRSGRRGTWVPTPCLEAVVIDSEHASEGPGGGAGGDLATFASNCFECVPRSAVLFSYPADGVSDGWVTEPSPIDTVMDGGDLKEDNARRHRVADRSPEHRKRKSASLKKSTEGRDGSASHRYFSDALETHEVSDGSDYSRSSLTRDPSVEIFPGEDSDPANAESSRGGGFGEALASGVAAALVGAVLSSAASHAAKLSPGRRETGGDDYVGDVAIFGHGDGDRVANSFEGVDGGRPGGREQVPSSTGSGVAVGDSEDSRRGFAPQSRRPGQNHRLRGSARDEAWLGEETRASGHWSPAEEGLEDQSTMQSRHGPLESRGTTRVATHHAPESVVSTRNGAPEYPPYGGPMMMASKQKRDTGTRWGETTMHRDPGTRKFLGSTDADFLMDEGGDDDREENFFELSTTDSEDYAASVYTRRGLQVRYFFVGTAGGRRVHRDQITRYLSGDHSSRGVTELCRFKTILLYGSYHVWNLAPALLTRSGFVLA